MSLFAPWRSRAAEITRVDDRGVRRTLYQGRTLDPLGGQRETIGDHELAKIAARLETLRAFNPRIRDRRLFAMRGVVAFVVMACLLALWKRFVPWASTAAEIVSFVLMMLFAFPWLGVRLRLPLTAMPDEIVRVFNEFRRCASCAYSLKELSPEADGCVVCPECGGAWRLRPIEPAMKRHTT